MIHFNGSAVGIEKLMFVAKGLEGFCLKILIHVCFVLQEVDGSESWFWGC